MSRFIKSKLLWAVMAMSLALCPGSALACAACYGKSDSPLAQGMNYGIFSLLAVVGFVLCGIGSVGVYFVRKAAANPVIEPPSTKA